MKIKQLKKFINSLSENELEKDLVYNSADYGLSGTILKVHRAKENLYYIGDDDPSPLYTKKQLIENYDMDEEEIKNHIVEIKKGDIVLEF
jgi:hypothetical protein